MSARKRCGYKRTFMGGTLCAYGVVSGTEHGNLLAGGVLFALGLALVLWAEWESGGFDV